MAFVAFCTTALAIWVIYDVSLNQQKKSLLAFARSQTELLETVTRFEKKHGSIGFEGNWERATLNQAIAFLKSSDGFRNTGEQVLGRLEGDQMIIFAASRSNGDDMPLRLPETSELAVPMRRALGDEEGTILARDYNNSIVLAAYTSIPDLGVGYVVKIDLDEFRSPFQKAIIPTLIGGLIMVFIGSLVSWIYAQKVIRRLRLSEENLRKTFDHASIGMALVGISGQWLKANKALCQLIGYSEKELLATDFQTITHPADLEADLRLVQDLIDGHIINYQMEKRYFHRNGSIIWVLLSVSLIRDTDSSPLYFISQIQNINERKKVEIENNRLQAELENRVAERTFQLESANNALESFAYSVSHDLRAPLRAMTGFSSALKEDYGAQLDATASDYIMRIDRATKRMADLIESMLVMSRSTQGDITLTEVDLGKITKDILNELQNQWPERKVIIDIAPSLKAKADARLIHNLMENLLGNAWKYTLKKDKPKITVGCKTVTSPREVEGEVRAFFVQDNGAGFDMAYANKLFRPFQRLHNESEFSGNGIGLATVERIVHRHGGHIWAESTINQGAIFYFTLNSI